jgi:hypothetical protein
VSKKNSHDTIGNRILDLPACSAMPQPTAPPRTPAEVPGIFSGDKSGQCVWLTTLPYSYADCFEIWGPRSSGKFRACSGISLSFTWHVTSGSVSVRYQRSRGTYHFHNRGNTRQLMTAIVQIRVVNPSAPSCYTNVAVFYTLM